MRKGRKTSATVVIEDDEGRKTSATVVIEDDEDDDEDNITEHPNSQEEQESDESDEPGLVCQFPSASTDHGTYLVVVPREQKWQPTGDHC